MTKDDGPPEKKGGLLPYSRVLRHAVIQMILPRPRECRKQRDFRSCASENTIRDNERTIHDDYVRMNALCLEP